MEPVPRAARALITELRRTAAGLSVGYTDDQAAAALVRVRDLAGAALRLLDVDVAAHDAAARIVLCGGCGRTVDTDGNGHHDRDCPAHPATDPAPLPDSAAPFRRATDPHPAPRPGPGPEAGPGPGPAGGPADAAERAARAAAIPGAPGPGAAPVPGVWAGPCT